MKKNILISIDGVDGVGKSTAVKRLIADGKYQLHKSPAGYFEDWRKEVDDHNNPLERYCFYRLALNHDGREIERLLKDGPVIVDRYKATTAAYHFAMDDRIRLIHNEEGLIEPDIAFLLTCNSEIRTKRIIGRKGNLSDKRLEDNSEFLDRVDAIFKTFGLTIIDTSFLSPDETVESLRRAIEVMESVK